MVFKLENQDYSYTYMSDKKPQKYHGIPEEKIQKMKRNGCGYEKIRRIRALDMKDYLKLLKSNNQEFIKGYVDSKKMPVEALLGRRLAEVDSILLDRLENGTEEEKKLCEKARIPLKRAFLLLAYKFSEFEIKDEEALRKEIEEFDKVSMEEVDKDATEEMDGINNNDTVELEEVEETKKESESEEPEEEE